MYKSLTAILLLMSCAARPAREMATPEKGWLVYHIPPDPELDDPHFTLCDVSKAYPYYGTGTRTRRDKAELISHFTKGFIPSTDLQETGFISIRFMVNCMGVPGRFRVIGFDNTYAAKKFDPRITSQLLALTKEVTDWEPVRHPNGSYDSYCYFLFKIEHGQLTGIMP